MTERELKQAAINRAALHACNVLSEPEAGTDYGRASQQLRRVAAAKMLRERLLDLAALDQGDARAAWEAKNCG
jgi:hypothetical protein